MHRFPEKTETFHRILKNTFFETGETRISKKHRVFYNSYDTLPHLCLYLRNYIKRDTLGIVHFGSKEIIISIFQDNDKHTDEHSYIDVKLPETYKEHIP